MPSISRPNPFVPEPGVATPRAVLMELIAKNENNKKFEEKNDNLKISI